MSKAEKIAAGLTEAQRNCLIGIARFLDAAARWMASAGLMVSIEDAIDAAVQAKAACRRAA